MSCTRREVGFVMFYFENTLVLSLIPHLINICSHPKMSLNGKQKKLLRGNKSISHPSSQDDANKNGGKWIIRLRKGLASRCWENLILAMLGEQFMVGEEICGAVVSVRFQVSCLADCQMCLLAGLHMLPSANPSNPCAPGGHYLNMEQDGQRPGNHSSDT